MLNGLPSFANTVAATKLAVLFASAKCEAGSIVKELTTSILNVMTACSLALCSSLISTLTVCLPVANAPVTNISASLLCTAISVATVTALFNADKV